MHRSSFAMYAGVVGLAMSGAFASACSRDAQAMTPQQLEQQYGVTGAYDGTVPTPDGSIKGTVVPVVLADGRKAQLVIPAERAREPHRVYMRDDNGLHPVEVSERANRTDMARSASVVETRTETEHPHKRSWEKDALIVGGSAGGGALIGAVAGGGKGAAVGATAGGIGGLIYDLATRDKAGN